jgi:AAA15 family ATPase/GTPase
MVVRISDKTQNYSKVTKLLVKPKNNKTGVSDLYSLDEFSPRKSENIQKGYLQGRYGAMPVVNLKDIEW